MTNWFTIKVVNWSSAISR